jgi:molybdopterin/thiamine biosynthesis adenylyltransferase
VVKSLSERIQNLARFSEELKRNVITGDDVRSLIANDGPKLRDLEIEALRLEVIPERYANHIGTVGIEGQIRILQSRVAVIGLGGIGGYVVEALARLGVGDLVLVDPDTFEGSNQNRQLLSDESSLGRAKAEVAAERVRAVNPAVKVDARRGHADDASLPQLLTEADVAVDALDRLNARLALERACRDARIPLVHAAIAGSDVEVMTIPPEGPGLLEVFGEKEVSDRGAEADLGTPVPSAMFAAALEVQEVIKLLTGRGTPMSGALHLFDLGTGECRRIEVGKP